MRTWTGLEGMVADGLPVIGASPSRSAFVHAFGFSAHGFALVPLVGEIVLDVLEGGKIGHDIQAFDPGRFATTDDAGVGASPSPGALPVGEERRA